MSTASPYSQAVARIRIGDLLVKAKLIDELQLQSALAHQRQWGGKLGDILITNGFLDEMMLWRGLSKQLGVELVSLPDEKFVPGIEKQIPYDLCNKHQVVPIHRDDKGLTLATSDPNNLGGIDEIAFRTGARLKVKLAPDREVEWALRRLYHGENAPCPPPRVRRFSGDPPSTSTTKASTPPPMDIMHLGRDTQTPIAHLAALASALQTSSTPPLPPASNMQSTTGAIAALLNGAAPSPWWTQPTASDAEVSVRETAHLLRFLVEACVQRGLFTREEFLAKLRAL